MFPGIVKSVAERDREKGKYDGTNEEQYLHEDFNIKQSIDYVGVEIQFGEFIVTTALS